MKKKRRKILIYIMMLIIGLTALPPCPYSQKVKAAAVLPLVEGGAAADLLITLFLLAAGYDTWEILTTDSIRDISIQDIPYASPAVALDFVDWHNNRYKIGVQDKPHVIDERTREWLQQARDEELRELMEVKKYDPNNKKFTDGEGNQIALKLLKDIYDFFRALNQKKTMDMVVKDWSGGEQVKLLEFKDSTGAYYTEPNSKIQRYAALIVWEEQYQEYHFDMAAGANGKMSYGSGDESDVSLNFRFIKRNGEVYPYTRRVSIGFKEFPTQFIIYSAVPIFSEWTAYYNYLKYGEIDSEKIEEGWKLQPNWGYPAIHEGKEYNMPDEVKSSEDLVRKVGKETGKMPVVNILGNRITVGNVNPGPEPEPEPSTEPTLPPVPPPDPPKTSTEPAPEPEPELELSEKDFKIDEGISRKFPFSIPADVVDVIYLLKATPKVPKFDIPMVLPALNINYTITVDLKSFDSVASICRWMLRIVYMLGLVILTRDLIRG